jgi:hypothetical protein
VSDLARAICRVVVNLAARRGLLVGSNIPTPSDRQLAFEEAAEVAIDRLLASEGHAQGHLAGEALRNARADVAHAMRQWEATRGELEACRAEVARHALGLAPLAPVAGVITFADHAKIQDPIREHFPPGCRIVRIVPREAAINTAEVVGYGRSGRTLWVKAEPDRPVRRVSVAEWRRADDPEGDVK